MGAGASVLCLESLTAEEVADAVCELGTAYAKYKDALISNGISGTVLAQQSEEEMSALFTDLEISSTLHQKVILSHFKLLKNRPGASGAQASTQVAVATTAAPVEIDTDGCQYHPLPEGFQVNDRVTQTPRHIMSKLFEIQGVSVDPTDLDPAVEKIAKAVGPGFGDGKNKFDCFINYRVAADADLAEKLFLYLKTKNIHAFLDKKCLKNGEKWKEGFLNGLKNSKCFVALISRKALDQVRNDQCDHTWDNVLLEYEAALTVRSFPFVFGTRYRRFFFY
jgi:hypothetical protein